MSTPDMVRPCARCATRFVATYAQLAVERHGHPVYCSWDCYVETKRQRAREFFRSEEGKAYQRARYAARAAKKKRKSTRRVSK